MANQVAIRVENLGKAYRIGLKEQQHETMLGAMAAWVKSPFRNFRDVRNLSRFQDMVANHEPQDTKSVVSGQLSVAPSEAPPSDIIWALKNVSFEVKHGEAVGIIGRNGAGKSTLLKILSRITEPTSGRATIHGRVGCLLEVGTGFHPDLTGRENVYLNGTILGMKKREIDAKFDEIVEFSGVETFIDTPVKRYSSGMRVRLAFSVAAHLEPEILIVDEVLAVGDAEFQRKCLARMDRVVGEGCTVLFVSHNMSAITSLTQRCVAFDFGQIVVDGPSARVIHDYLGRPFGGGLLGRADWQKAPVGNSQVRLISFQIGCDGVTTDFRSDEPIPLTLEFSASETIRGLRVGFDLYAQDGQLIFRAYHDDTDVERQPVEGGFYRARAILPPNLLNQGEYSISVRAGIQNVRRICVIDQAVHFRILNLRGNNSQYSLERPGIINPVLNWSLEHLEGTGGI